MCKPCENGQVQGTRIKMQQLMSNGTMGQSPIEIKVMAISAFIKKIIIYFTSKMTAELYTLLLQGPDRFYRLQSNEGKMPPKSPTVD